MKIADILPEGRTNAISSKYLASQLGFSDIRALQAAIQRERRSGSVILSSGSGGYFKPSGDPTEISSFIKTLNARARHTRESTLSAQLELDRLSGQARINGFK